jgi:hypothetical protein
MTERRVIKTIKYTNAELDLMADEIKCDPVELLKQLRDWQEESASNTVIATLDTVADMILNN